MKQFDLYEHTQPRNLDSYRDSVTADRLCNRTVQAVQKALRHNSPSNVQILVSELLEQQLVSNRAITMLNSNHYEANGLLPESYSILREQVERIFMIAYITRIGEEACQRFSIDAWFKVAFEAIVNEIELEQTGIFQQEFESKRKLLETYATILGLSVDELQSVRSLVDQRRIPRAQRPFPSVADIRKELLNTDVSAVLNRAYVEYSLLCGYTHSGMSKVAMRMLHQNRHSSFDLGQLESIRKAVDRVLSESEVYVALGCAVALFECNNDLDALIAVEDMWREIEAGSMLATAFWKLGVEDLFPKSIKT